ncbi:MULTISPECIES: hypothetical protein [Paenibacillus]|uniref:hypothetical protein n=1 Tax=Paenibacillus TaxID=44249 RepID=UPI001E49CB0A|nr:MULTISPECIES: hypothetical protein [Paenibacillus]
MVKIIGTDRKYPWLTGLAQVRQMLQKVSGKLVLNDYPLLLNELRVIEEPFFRWLRAA